MLADMAWFLSLPSLLHPVATDTAKSSPGPVLCTQPIALDITLMKE